jgi:hypothetical protein
MRNGVGKSRSHVGVLTPRSDLTPQSDLTQDEIPD